MTKLPLADLSSSSAVTLRDAYRMWSSFGTCYARGEASCDFSGSLTVSVHYMDPAHVWPSVGWKTSRLAQCLPYLAVKVVRRVSKINRTQKPSSNSAQMRGKKKGLHFVPRWGLSVNIFASLEGMWSMLSPQSSSSLKPSRIGIQLKTSHALNAVHV